MQVRDVYKKVAAMIDEFSNDGIPIADQDNADVIQKVILFADMAQKEWWKYNKATKQVELTLIPPLNLLGVQTNLLDFNGTTQYYPNEDGIPNVHAYSAMVDGDSTIKVQENINGVWTDLVSLTPTIDTLTTFKGVISPSSATNKVRLVLGGTTHYRHVNRALYGVKYKANKVPTYAEFVKYDLPSDFQSIDMVVEEYPSVYGQASMYRVENYRDFYYDYNFEGRIRITYKPICLTVTSLEDTLQVDDILANNIVYDVLAKIGFYENTDVVNWAEGRRAESKRDASMAGATSAVIIKSYYD